MVRKSDYSKEEDLRIIELFTDKAENENFVYSILTSHRKLISKN